MSTPPVIVWFRQDLRLHDNPAWIAACHSGAPVLPVYILDDYNAGPWAMGGASRWWLHQSLSALNEQLSGRLAFFKGDAYAMIDKLIADTGASAVHWNRCYEPWRIERDKRIKTRCKDNGIEVQTFNGSLLWEPWQTLKDDGTPYQVFTPFYRRGCRARNGAPPEPEKLPAMPPLASAPKDALPLEALALMPRVKWYGTMAESWTPGEKGAQARLDEFLAEGLHGYKEGRNYPSRPNISRLSPHLHFGEISPRVVWHTASARGIAEGWDTDLECFCSELGWREFSHSLLYHFPKLPTDPLQEKFNAFPWDKNPEGLERWQQGQTGYPIVDAGMRELWATGYMHNRVRMIVGSFLVKDLLLHWHHGEQWFWDTLVDADLANNSASWQWIAGCGADAAPYFRVFNPTTQGTKFDPDGDYVRRWVPELAALPGKQIHTPWDSGEKLDYPKPIVDHKAARERALEAFGKTKG
ncbi:MAG: deoxyribodipyrimidine photo-lyase [Rhodospirillales bacterium]|nr:deoxyribodipyrimidine photo-lyase [Rhodospirillales bacterium]MCB9995917.1 deoxyribodipyrimidine photo-lyase [Rhodospirillales bacterium]